MSTSEALKQISQVARPLIEQALDIAEQLAGLCDVATAKGLDWSALKALIKAQIEDERDDSDGKRVRKIIDKADFATAYADMLGLTNMNEKNFSPPPVHVTVEVRETPIAEPAPEPHDPETGELPDLPAFLDRRAKVAA